MAEELDGEQVGLGRECDAGELRVVEQRGRGEAVDENQSGLERVIWLGQAVGGVDAA